MASNFFKMSTEQDQKLILDGIKSFNNFKVRSQSPQPECAPYGATRGSAGGSGNAELSRVSSRQKQNLLQRFDPS